MNSAGPRWPTGAVSGLSIAAGAAGLFGLWRMLDDGAPSSNQYALSPQECTTACQTRQTDCILDCDGQLPCERKCTEVGKACVGRCRHPDAGAGGAAGSGAGSARRRGLR